MKFIDPIPPTSPSIHEQADALQKGLGRAMQWAIAGKLDEAPLLQACFVDQRHDMQVEGRRSDWLWKLIETVDCADRFRAPLLDALTTLSPEFSAYQLCELAYFYAAAGDQAFRKRLYEIVVQWPIPDFPDLGEEEIVRLDGERGFLFAARIRGASLYEYDWGDGDAVFTFMAMEYLGEARLAKALEESTDSAVKQFRKCWLREEAQASKRVVTSSIEERMRAISADEIITAARQDCPTLISFLGWGRYATDSDLNKVLQHLWSADRPESLFRFLTVFGMRALPIFDPRLIELCYDTDDLIRLHAFNALRMNAHPLVREFAIANMRQGLRDRFVAGLFVRNYVRGDESLLLDAMVFHNEINHFHWLLMSIIEVLKHNADADPSKLALVVYIHTPCQNCRRRAVELLLSRNAAPDWLIEEYQYDSEEDCQEIIQGYA